MQNHLALFAVATALTGCISEDDLDTASLESAITVDGWLNDLQISGQSSGYQVGVAELGTRLHVLYQGTSNAQLRATSFNGSSWSSPTTTNLQSDYGPSLVNHAGTLVTVYKSAGQNRLLMSTSTNGTSWSTPVQVGAPPSGSTLRYAPAVTSYNGTLYIGYCLRDPWGERFRIDRRDGSSWTPVRTLYLTDSVCKSVAFGLDRSGSMNYVFNTESPSTWYLYNGFIRSDGSTTVAEKLTMKSKKPSSVVTCGGITHFVHGGYSSPESIYWTYRRSDGTWAQDAAVPSQASSGGAALGCLGGTRAIMVHNGGYPQLWWSEYVPN